MTDVLHFLFLLFSDVFGAVAAFVSGFIAMMLFVRLVAEVISQERRI
jgi:hypothetical protein